MATKSQEILLKGNTTNASAVPSSLKVREIAINALDRSLFTNDGNSIVKLYTGTTKWFDVNGNANNALKLGGILASEYINKEAFNSHINNSTIHITSAERNAWNNKWDYNEDTIKGIKVNAAVSADKATKLATARKIWGKYFDGLSDVSGDLIDVGNITASGKATIQGDIISGGEVVAVAGEGTPAGVTDYSALTGKPSINGVTLVSGNNTLAALGIQAAGDYATNSGVTTLLADYAKKTFVANNYAGKAAFNAHTADTDIHMTAAERAAWNAKWDYNEATIKAVKVTSASSADKLNSSEGTSAIPIYFKNGKPTQCIPSDLFSGFDNAYSSTETSLGITIAGYTKMVVVAYSQTAGSVAWTGITGKPTTFTPSAHTHAASDVSGLPTSLKNPYKLTFGSKTYDGSAAATITASDLGALTAHQSIYAFTLQVNGTSKGTYNPASAAKIINIAVPTKTSDITNDSGFITSASIPTALKNPYAVEIKANGVSLGTYDGSKAATFNLSAANVGAANKVHTHTASEISGLPTKLSAFTNDVGYITGITKSMVEGVLTGNITSHTHNYLPLTGGEISGNITWYKGKWGVDVNSRGVFMSWNDANYLHITNDGAFYNWNSLIHSGNYNSYAPTLTGTGASGTWGISISGNAATATNADTLDGIHYQNILERKNSGYCNYESSTGWFRIAESLSVDSSGISFLLAIQRSYNNANNESYLFSISISYNGGISITQLSGYANVRLITKIRVDWVGTQIAYVDLYIASASGNQYSWYTIGCAKSYTAWTANPTLVGTAYEFTTMNGCKSDRGFTGDLVGNASSATKLQDNTAFTAWGQTFFESGKPKNVSGHLSMEWSEIYWNGDINGSYISSNGTTDMVYNMRNGHIFQVGGDRILIIKKYDTYKLQVNGKTHIKGDLVVDGEVSALVA